MHIVYITCSESEALEITQALIRERLAACVNNLGKINSTYWWEGKIEESTEAALFVKTKESLVDQVIAKVKSIHSAKVPCIVSFPIEKGNPDYLAWLAKEVK